MGRAQAKVRSGVADWARHKYPGASQGRQDRQRYQAKTDVGSTSGRCDIAPKWSSSGCATPHTSSCRSSRGSPQKARQAHIQIENVDLYSCSKIGIDRCRVQRKQRQMHSWNYVSPEAYLRSLLDSLQPRLFFPRLSRIYSPFI